MAAVAIAADALAAAAMLTETVGAFVGCDCRSTTAGAKLANRIHAAACGAAYGTRQFGKRAGDDIHPLNAPDPNSFCTAEGLWLP